MRKVKHKLKIIKILEEDFKKIKKWGFQRDMYDYQIINQLINK